MNRSLLPRAVDVAVSRTVDPASRAASITARVASRSIRRPKLSHPSPTRETRRSELPSGALSTPPALRARSRAAVSPPGADAGKLRDSPARSRAGETETPDESSGRGASRREPCACIDVLACVRDVVERARGELAQLDRGLDPRRGCVDDHLLEADAPPGIEQKPDVLKRDGIPSVPRSCPGVRRPRAVPRSRAAPLALRVDALPAASSSTNGAARGGACAGFFVGVVVTGGGAAATGDSSSTKPSRTAYRSPEQGPRGHSLRRAAMRAAVPLQYAEPLTTRRRCVEPFVVAPSRTSYGGPVVRARALWTRRRRAARRGLRAGTRRRGGARRRCAAPDSRPALVRAPRLDHRGGGAAAVRGQRHDLVARQRTAGGRASARRARLSATPAGRNAVSASSRR